MPSRTSLLLSLSAISILNSALAQRPSPQSNELEGQRLQTFNELPNSIPDGSPHDTLAHAVLNLEHTYLSHGEETIRALHDHDAETAMDTLSLAHVDLVRRQLPSVALPSLAATVGASLPTSVGNLLPTAEPTMPTAEPTTVQSSAPPVITSFVTSTTQVLPSSTPIDTSIPPSSVPSSTPTSVAPVPTSTTQAPPTATSVVTTSSSSTPQESSGTTSLSAIAPVPVPFSTTTSSGGFTSSVQSTLVPGSPSSGAAAGTSAVFTSPGGFATSSPAAPSQNTGTTIASASSSAVGSDPSSDTSIVYSGFATPQLTTSAPMSSGFAQQGSYLPVVVPPVQISDAPRAPTSVTTNGFVNTALSSLGTSDVMPNTETTMAMSTTGTTMTSATFPTTSSAMTLMTMMISSDNPDLSSSAAPTSQAPVASSTPSATSNAVGGGGIVGGGGDSSSAAVVVPMPSTSTTQAANGNGGIGGISGGSGPGSITTTDQFGGTIVFPSTTEGAVLTLTDSSGRVFTTTYNPRGTVQETMVVSTQLSGAGGGLVTQTAFVNPSAASGIDGGQPSIATATRGQAGLQTGNVADMTHRAGAEALALAVGAMGVAWAL